MDPTSTGNSAQKLVIGRHKCAKMAQLTERSLYGDTLSSVPLMVCTYSWSYVRRT